MNFCWLLQSVRRHNLHFPTPFLIVSTPNHNLLLQITQTFLLRMKTLYRTHKYWNHIYTEKQIHRAKRSHLFNRLNKLRWNKAALPSF